MAPAFTVNTMLDYRSSRGVGGECDWGSVWSRGQPRGSRAERASSGTDAGAVQPEPTVPSSDQTGSCDRQLLPVPVLRQQVQDLLSAQVPPDPAQRGAGEYRGRYMWGLSDTYACLKKSCTSMFLSLLDTDKNVTSSIPLQLIILARFFKFIE